MLELGSAATRFDVTSFGEALLRLSVPAGEQLADAQSLQLHVGGAESNTCAALACLQHACGWVSRLPANPLGRMVVRRLSAARVDTSAVTFVDHSRVGTYYVECAAPPRPTRVSYDRAHSAASAMSVREMDWDYLLDTRILHLTGITPALSESCRELVSEALGRARAKRVAVSFDVNYRAKLWPASEARRALEGLIRDANLLFCSRRDATEVFGLNGDSHDVLAGLRELSGAEVIVMSLGGEGVMALEGDRILEQQTFPVAVVDRPGAGDALAAGVLSGLLTGSLSDGLRRGSALAAMALSQVGDMVVTDPEEVEAVLSKPAAAISR